MVPLVKARPLIWYLAALSAAIATPLLVLTFIMGFSWVGSERARLETSLAVRLEGAVLLVDQYLSGRIAMMQALATSRAIDTGDFETLDRQAREMLALHGGQIVVRGLDGTNFVNTRLNWDAKLPRGRIVEADREAVSTKSPYVDDLYTTVLDGSPVLRIVVPVLRSGEVLYTIVSDVPAGAVERLLQRAGILAPFFASVADRKGLVLARAENSEKYVGSRLPGFEKALGQHGFWSGTNPEGIAVEAAFQRSSISGWLFSIGVGKAALSASLRNWMWTLGAVSLALLLLAGCVALTVARNLLRSQRRVAEVVRSLGRGELIDRPETSLVEANEIVDALVDASHKIRSHAAVLADTNATLEARVEDRTREVSAQAELLQATLDNMDQGLFLIAPDGTVPIANRRSLELLELPTELMSRRPAFTDILTYQLQTDEFARSDLELREWVEGGGLLDGPHNYERERPDGTILEIRTIPLPNGGAVRTFTDVTLPRRREMALQTSQAEYRDLFENAVVGIFRTTRDGVPIRANPALARLNGYESEAECLSRSLDLQTEWYVHPGRRTDFVAAMDTHGRVT
jgi:PAS domain-containing protein